jgi:osmotically-inducible protein OsmY
MRYVAPMTALIIFCAGLLQGCAGAVVAGAATGAAVATDRRTTGQMIDDQALELKAQKLIAEDPQLKNTVRVNVTSMNGIVLLTGEAETRALRNRALGKVRTVPGIRRINNHIRIASPAGPFTKGRRTDKWITSKIKGKQTTTEGVGPTHVKVVTSNSVVYLMGLVDRSEADVATKLARDTKGVTRVVRIFEYTD